MNLRAAFEAGDEQQKANTLEVSRVDLPTYMEFVHGWEVRAHQRPWVTALDALLVAPTCYLEGGVSLSSNRGEQPVVSSGSEMSLASAGLVSFVHRKTVAPFAREFLPINRGTPAI